MTRFIIKYETIHFIPPHISFKIHIRQFLNKLIFNSIKPFELVTIIQNNMNTIIFLSISPASVFFVPDNPR